MPIFSIGARLERRALQPAEVCAGEAVRDLNDVHHVFVQNPLKSRHPRSDEEEGLKARCHYRSAKVDNVVYCLEDDVYVKLRQMGGAFRDGAAPDLCARKSFLSSLSIMRRPILRRRTTACLRVSKAPSSQGSLTADNYKHSSLLGVIKSDNAVLGLPYALANQSFCKSFNLDLLEASATLTLAELWLALGSSHAKKALSLVYQSLPMILGH
ncbi:Anaphase-promoting complex subunit 5, partial [Zea mays]